MLAPLYAFVKSLDMRKNQLCLVIQHTLFSCITESFSTICKTHESKAYSTAYLTEEQNCLENRYFCRVTWVCAKWAAWRTLQSSQRTTLYPELLHHCNPKAAGPELVKLLRFILTQKRSEFGPEHCYMCGWMGSVSLKQKRMYGICYHEKTWKPTI